MGNQTHWQGRITTMTAPVPQSHPKNIAVLMGGISRERDVSLSTGTACITALTRAGYTVTPIDVINKTDFVPILKSLNPDVVFNALHGEFGEDGQVQKILNDLKIPYTHSGVKSSATALNKGVCQPLFRQHAIPTAHSHVATQTQIQNGENLMDIPYVVKAVCEGSSLGIAIIKTPQDTEQLKNWHYGDGLVEQYIDGRELTCTVLDINSTPTPLAITELVSHGTFYDYDAKYSPDTTIQAQHLCPAPLPDSMYNRITTLAVQCHRVLGCRGISRTDFIWDEQADNLVVLETNTHPGMTSTSHAPEQAVVAGYDFEFLVSQLVGSAQCD